MKRHLYILLLSALLIGCAGKKSVTLPTYSDITVTPAKSTYALGDSVVCSIKMLTPGDASLKKSTYWFYTSWWGSNPNLTADFQTPETVDGATRFTSSKIELAQAGEVRIYFWGRLEYPNWDFQPVQIPVTLHVE